MASPVTRYSSLVTDGGSPSVYRIQEPQSGLYVRFHCATPIPGGNTRITARLTQRDRATRFPTFPAAARCFARALGAAPLEIVRSDA